MIKANSGKVDAILLALQRKEPEVQECKECGPRCWKRQQMDSPVELPEGGVALLTTCFGHLASRTIKKKKNCLKP